MWPLFSKKKRLQQQALERAEFQQKRLQQIEIEAAELKQRMKAFNLKMIVDEIGDAKAFIHDDVAVKFWVPELVEQGLQEIAQLSNQSLSAMLRDFLLIHCYGVYAFNVISERSRRVSREGALFSRSRNSAPTEPTYWVALLGKNIAPIKLWVPEKLKEDLQTLADLASLKLSHYIREIVISRLFGHGMLPMRPEVLNVEPTDDLDRWCNDEEIEMHQVDYEEYLKHPVGEVRYVFKSEE